MENAPESICWFCGTQGTQQNPLLEGGEMDIELSGDFVFNGIEAGSLTIRPRLRPQICARCVSAMLELVHGYKEIHP